MKKKTSKTVCAHGNGNKSENIPTVCAKGGKQDANLSKNGFVNFQIGLILSLFMVFVGLEATFKIKAERKTDSEDSINLPLEYYSDLQNITIERPKSIDVSLQQKNLNPDDFTIVPDDENTGMETEFIQIPTAYDDRPLNPASLNVIEDALIEDIPIFLVEEVPIFPGCESVSKEDRILCFQEKMQLHIKRNFKYPEAEQDLGIHGRVSVMFKIDVDGTITDIQMKGPSRGLETEAKRIITKLPTMVPGKQGGRAVRVPFSIPINFKLQQ